MEHSSFKSLVIWLRVCIIVFLITIALLSVYLVRVRPAIQQNDPGQQLEMISKGK